MSFINPINKSFCLEQIYQANYQKLFRLIPNLLSVQNGAVGLTPLHSTLHLKVMDQTPYTMTVELSHCFNSGLDKYLQPAVIIRIYLDAQLAEVLSDHARPSVARIFQKQRLSNDIMDYKWRLNYFLQKWLDHCLKKNYRFSEGSAP